MAELQTKQVLGAKKSINEELADLMTPKRFIARHHHLIDPINANFSATKKEKVSA